MFVPKLVRSDQMTALCGLAGFGSSECSVWQRMCWISGKDGEVENEEKRNLGSKPKGRKES